MPSDDVAIRITRTGIFEYSWRYIHEELGELNGIFARPPDIGLWRITASDHWMDSLIDGGMVPTFREAVDVVLRLVGEAALQAARNEREVLEYGADAMGLDLPPE